MTIGVLRELNRLVMAARQQKELRELAAVSRGNAVHGNERWRQDAEYHEKRAQALEPQVNRLRRVVAALRDVLDDD